jgi:hypothetical protein
MSLVLSKYFVLFESEVLAMSESSRVVVVCILFVSCLFVCLFVLRFEPRTASESVVNESFNLKHHAAYGRAALQRQDGGEMATDARSQMVNAGPATDDNS